MLSQEVLESLECSYTHESSSSSTLSELNLNPNIKHISKNPLILSCGHSICKSCIPKSKQQTIIKCIHCNQINQNDLNTTKECLSQKVLFKVYMSKLFELIEDTFKNELKILRENFFEKNLTTKIDSIKNEIEQRVITLKQELDTHKNNIYCDLERIKDELMRSAQIDNNLDDLVKKLNDTHEKIAETTENLTEDKFFDMQDTLLELHHINLDLLKNNFELDFKESTLKMDAITLGTLNYQNYSIKYVDSSILCRNELTKLNKLCEFSSRSNWKLIYRGSRDGFTASKFHTLCDNHSNTLCLIQTIDDHVFGGFTTQTWNAPSSGYNYKADPHAFLLSLKNSHNLSAKFPIQDASKAIYCIADYGPIFGEGSDFYIIDGCNLNANSWTTFPFTYSAPDHITPEMNFLASSRNFQVKDIEVFNID